MWYHKNLSSVELLKMVTSNQLTLSGNIRLKIYGTLYCVSGRRMKKENRLFFSNEVEAIQFGYRPCGHCLRKKYREWKNVRKNQVEP
jgi:hypothetical protein